MTHRVSLTNRIFLSKLPACTRVRGGGDSQRVVGADLHQPFVAGGSRCHHLDRGLALVAQRNPVSVRRIVLRRARAESV